MAGVAPVTRSVRVVCHGKPDKRGRHGTHQHGGGVDTGSGLIPSRRHQQVHGGRHHKQRRKAQRPRDFRHLQQGDRVAPEHDGDGDRPCRCTYPQGSHVPQSCVNTHHHKRGRKQGVRCDREDRVENRVNRQLVWPICSGGVIHQVRLRRLEPMQQLVRGKDQQHLCHLAWHCHVCGGWRKRLPRSASNLSTQHHHGFNMSSVGRDSDPARQSTGALGHSG